MTTCNPIAVPGRQGHQGRPMNLPQAILSCFEKCATFSGRAARSEYWYFFLFYVLGRIGFAILDAAVYGAPVDGGHVGPFEAIFTLILLLPYTAAEVRRLHDVDRSGWWLLISFTIIGAFYPLLVWKCTKGTVGPNRFGEDSLERDRVVAQFE